MPNLRICVEGRESKRKERREYEKMKIYYELDSIGSSTNRIDCIDPINLIVIGSPPHIDLINF